MSLPKILVTAPIDELWRAKLESAYPGAGFCYVPETDVRQEDVTEADIILGNVPAALLPQAHKLKWLQLSNAGVEPYIRPGVLGPGVQLLNATGAYGLAISEHMLGCTLMLIKRLNRYYANQREHLWRDEGSVTSIEGAHALVVGLGDIGGEYGKRIKALGGYVTGIRKHPGAKPDWLDGLYPMEALDEQLPKADIVALSLPETPETHGLFNYARLCRMKRSAVLLNVGRGTAVVTDDLCRALNEKMIYGAFLDVTDPEPLPPEHPLWEAENVILTPHISGQYHLRQTREKILQIAAENLRRWRCGEALLNPVDFTLGYRRPVG